MASKAKLTDAQKKALIVYIGAEQKCRQAFLSEIQSMQLLSSVYNASFGDMDIMYAKLIGKQITIGEANTLKTQIVAKRKTDYANATTRIDDQFKGQINQEISAMQAEDMQRRAIAAQYLMNQQSINAAQQMNNQNQINNNNRVINTNCNKTGNQTNCTSY